MRIAILSTPFVSVPPSRYGGTELIIADLAEELVRRGHDVTVYATGDSQTSARLRSVYEVPVWPPNPYDELHHATWAIADVIASEPPYDVVHVHVPAALALARFIDAPMVYTLHHDRDERLAAYYLRAGQDAVSVAISERQRQLIPESGASHVVQHGLDVGRYPLGDGSAGYAAFLGRLARVKAPHRAIRAALAAGAPIRVAGVPHWEDLEFFRAEVAPLLEGPGVVHLGAADHPTKVELLAGALATLFPIEWEEPFGLVMIESMLCGTPVIAFRRGAVPEVVDEGITGFVVDSEEGMASRLRQLARGGFDRRACRERAVQRFSAARMAADYLAVYDAACRRALVPVGHARARTQQA